MSGRAFWIAVGAVGGIVVYRRGQRVLAQARERGLVGNVTAIANTAARAAELLGSAPRQYPDWVEPPAGQNAQLLNSIEVTPIRRIPLGRSQSRIPSTALRLRALPPHSIVDLREVRVQR